MLYFDGSHLILFCVISSCNILEIPSSFNIRISWSASGSSACGLIPLPLNILQLFFHLGFQWCLVSFRSNVILFSCCFRFNVIMILFVNTWILRSGWYGLRKGRVAGFSFYFLGGVDVSSMPEIISVP